MSPDFVCVYGQATAAEALERLRLSQAAAETLEVVFVMNTQRRLYGAIALADLVRADPDAVHDRRRAAAAHRPGRRPRSRRSRA